MGAFVPRKLGVIKLSGYQFMHATSFCFLSAMLGLDLGKPEA